MAAPGTAHCRACAYVLQTRFAAAARFTDLPPEVVAEILKSLDQGSLGVVRRVQRWLRDIVDLNAWRRVSVTSLRQLRQLPYVRVHAVLPTNKTGITLLGKIDAARAELGAIDAWDQTLPKSVRTELVVNLQRAIPGDLSVLGRVHTLTLTHKFSFLTGVTDVRALSNVSNLTLGFLRDLTDVSALGRVHTLALLDLHRVADVSALGGVHTLTLRRLYSVEDVSALGGVTNLTLIDMPHVRGIPQHAIVAAD